MQRVTVDPIHRMDRWLDEGAMASVAFLIDTAPDEVSLGPHIASGLARLGVSSLTVYRDGRATCLVLEGWAFDPSSWGSAAAVIGIAPPARLLHPVMQSALGAIPEEER